MMDRADFINGLLGRPYRLGASGPEAFDCYGLARHIQAALFGRTMPDLRMPDTAGRLAMAAMLAAHPERANWRESPVPVDGALVEMAHHVRRFHLGVFVADDGGLVVHTVEGDTGVRVDTLMQLDTAGWRSLTFHVPA